MPRRRRSLILKIILGASIIYFACFVFLSRLFVSKDSAVTAGHGIRRRYTPGTNPAGVGDVAEVGDVDQPVLERLDLERFRFQEAMHRDAERSEQRKRRLEEEKRHHEEDRRRRAADRVIPPFRGAFPNVVYSDTLNSTQLTEQKAAMTKMLPLIASGHVVVRWNYEKEVPLVPGSLGIFYITPLCL